MKPITGIVDCCARRERPHCPPARKRDEVASPHLLPLRQRAAAYHTVE